MTIDIDREIALLLAQKDQLDSQKTKIEEHITALIELRNKFYQTKEISQSVIELVPESVKINPLTAAHARKLEQTQERVRKIREMAGKSNGQFTLKDCANLLFSHTTQPSTNACSFLERQYSHFERVDRGTYRVKSI